MAFNPNELVLERVRSVEEYNPSTKELTGRYSQIEDPSLSFSAEGTDVTDAMGATIMTFYNAQTGTFSFTNSLFSLDLAASQFGSEKKVADNGDTLYVPVTEILTIADNTATLKYTPYGTVAGAEIGSVTIINDDNTLGAKYRQAATIGTETDVFTLADKVITFPAGVVGRVLVSYTRVATKNAVEIDKFTDSEPGVKTLLIHAIFHDPCDKNIVYAGVIYCPRAQIDPSSVELNLTSDGKHAASYLLQKEYCSEESKLCSIFVVNDNDDEDVDPEPTPTDKATLSALSITGVTLVPDFAAGTVAYTGTATEATGVITATGADGATAEVTVQGGTIEDGTITWADGENVVTIVVSKADAESTTYTVTVTK